MIIAVFIRMVPIWVASPATGAGACRRQPISGSTQVNIAIEIIFFQEMVFFSDLEIVFCQ